MPCGRDARRSGAALSLAFRNLDVSPDDPVEGWPTEAVLTALERGGLSHWRRLAVAVRADPWGPVARRVEEALHVARPYGVDVLMAEVISSARERAAREERTAVAAEIGAPRAETGLSRARVRLGDWHVHLAPVHLPDRHGHALGGAAVPDAAPRGSPTVTDAD